MESRLDTIKPDPFEAERTWEGADAVWIATNRVRERVRITVDGATIWLPADVALIVAQDIANRAREASRFEWWGKGR